MILKNDIQCNSITFTFVPSPYLESNPYFKSIFSKWYSKWYTYLHYVNCPLLKQINLQVFLLLYQLKVFLLLYQLKAFFSIKLLHHVNFLRVVIISMIIIIITYIEITNIEITDLIMFSSVLIKKYSTKHSRKRFRKNPNPNTKFYLKHPDNYPENYYPPENYFYYYSLNSFYNDLHGYWILIKNHFFSLLYIVMMLINFIFYLINMVTDTESELILGSFIEEYNLNDEEGWDMKMFKYDYLLSRLENK